jgi:RNA polymerase sigma factor (sigma-70 family)
LHYLSWRSLLKRSVGAMANGLGGTVLPQLQRIFHGGTLAGMTDGQLLERFAARNDEAAFEALLARHGPLVLTVCRNLLRDRDDVEDAFQATLLVLVRKAGSIRLEASLGPWIYSVAYRVAIRARANRILRTSRENTVADLDPQAPSGDLDGHDVSPLLHDELARLPERLRAPIVLCYLQGLTHESAAEQLCWPVGTVRSRMARARTLLRERLTRKGVALSAGFLIGSSRQTNAAMIPRVLADETTQAAMRVAAGQAAVAGVLSTRAAALMEGVLMAMKLTKLKAVATVALVPGFVLVGWVALAVQAPGHEPDRAVPTNPRQSEQAEAPTPESPPKNPLKAEDGTPNRLGLEELLARWEKRGVDFSLDVSFTRHDKYAKWDTETYQGRFILKSPDRVFLDMDKVGDHGRPPHQRVVRNREFLYHYNFEHKIITTSKVPWNLFEEPRLLALGLKPWLKARGAVNQARLVSGESLPLLFFMNAAAMRHNYAIELVEETASSAVIQFTPLKPREQEWIEKGFVQLDKSRYFPRVVRVVGPNAKDTKTFSFTSIIWNGAVDDSHFEPKSWEGWTIETPPDHKKAPEER